MPRTSYADIIRDWDSLLTAVKDNAAELPDAERHRAALQQHLEETKALKAQQDAARAVRQRSTQMLDEMLNKGKELAVRLRGSVRASIGPKNELLVQYGVAPQRKRKKSAAGKPTEVPSPQAPEAATQPAAKPAPSSL